MPFGIYYQKPVLWATNRNITSGTGGNLFSPNSNCTRAQVIKFLWNAADRPEPGETVKNDFTDVSPDSYYYKAVLWAVEKGITHGTDPTHFGPNEPCTRGQVAAFLWAAHGKHAPEHTDTVFEDISPENFYYIPVLWAAENNIAHGIDPTHFNPNGTCTRGQFAAFLWSAEGRPNV